MPTGCPNWVSLESDGVLTVAEAGTYKVDVLLTCHYSDRTDIPINAKVQRYDASDSQIAGTSLNNVLVITNRAPALNTKVTTAYTQLLQLQAN